MDWEGRIWRSPIDGKRVRITGLNHIQSYCCLSVTESFVSFSLPYPFIHSHPLMNDDDGDDGDDVNQQM